MTRLPAAWMLLMALAGGPAASGQDAGALATWRDGEIRESFDASARETRVFVAVMPSGPQGSLTVVISARWPGRVQTKPLTEFEVRADIGIRVNPNFIRQPTLVFVLDPESNDTRTLDLSSRLQLPPRGAGSAIDSGIAAISMVELIQLLRADAVIGEVFALPVTFTPSQLESLRKFGDRVLAPPQ